jgi:hypothetical protein
VRPPRKRLSDWEAVEVGRASHNINFSPSHQQHKRSRPQRWHKAFIRRVNHCPSYGAIEY